MILLDYKDRRPIYEQVVSKLEELMLLGAMKENEPLPSVRSLAMELSINPNTIQRAYAELERQGYIYSIKGKGNFVADNGHVKEAGRQEVLQRQADLAKEAWAGLLQPGAQSAEGSEDRLRSVRRAAAC